ncbi:MAG TPA: magnesium/cobalt transporter CorA [Thermoleophilaceae bacterium]|jgi:magnesium transporter
MIVDCAVYQDGERRDGAVKLHDAYEACRSDGVWTWIGLYEPTEDEFDSIKREFDLHELAVEDAINAHQRPKLEVYDDMLFVVLKTARYIDSIEVVEFGEILVFLGEDYIITVRHGEGSALHDVRLQLEKDREHLAKGPGTVLHAIMDRIVDDYSPALAGLNVDVEQVEEEVFSGRRSNPAQRIYYLKREVLQFIRATAPLINPLDRLAAGHYAQVHPEVTAYFRDVNDHILRVHETLEGMRDLLTSVLAANMSQVGVRQNEDMRKISAWVAIAAVPTMIAGIYGMNFDHMPELRWELGYPAVVVVMLMVCSTLYWRFRKAGWL